MTTETWRVVDGLGGVREVPVRFESGLLLVGPGPQPRYYASEEPPRLAVMHYALTMRWPLREILAPGEMTAAERVAAERARCAAACRKVAEGYHHGACPCEECEGRCNGALECVEAIGRGSVGT